MSRKRKKIRKPLVDIVIPVYGRFDLLKKCLESIPEAVGNIAHTIKIIDNNSPEPGSFFGELPDNIDVIRNNQNKGFVGACNQGASRGKAPLIFFLNSDVILEKGSLDKLIRSLDEPKVGIAGMKLVFPDTLQLEESGLNPQIRPAKAVQHMGLVTNIRGEVVHAFIGWSSDSEKVNSVSEVMAVTGAALLIRRKLFKLVGMFDKSYGMGTYEDVDLCMSVRKLGYNVIVNPEAVGTHFVGATSEKYKQAFPLNENYQHFISKWKNELRQWDYNIL